MDCCFQRVHAARPVNSNSLAFLVTGIVFVVDLLLHFFFVCEVSCFCVF